MKSYRHFLEAESTLAWLGQFTPENQPAAVEMLREMVLVSRDKFAERLQALVLKRMRDDKQPIAIYVEREIRKWRGVPNRLFKEPRRKVKRAYGGGPQSVQPIKLYDQTVGSEGIVAQLIGELCRQNSNVLLNHPGPDLIRKYKVRRFFLVTDFVGSGERASNYLHAAWRVRSVRSWWSRRPNQGFSFEVIAYAATPSGRKAVEDHPAQPEVHTVTACPTIDTCFAADKRPDIEDLCRSYNPSKSDAALGYRDTGALIAFAHGMPNNAPSIFHKRSKYWEPLFPARITSSTPGLFKQEDHDPSVVRDRLIAMRQTRLAEAAQLGNMKPESRVALLILAALGRPPRKLETLSRKTGLTYLDVKQALAKAVENGWVDSQYRLTDKGQAELRNVRRPPVSDTALPPDPETFYYPSSLRAPSQVSR